jgi:hypothetical protein
MTTTSDKCRAEFPDKLSNMIAAHLDGVYKFSARENCDELVTQLIEENHSLTIQLEAELKWRRDNDND